MKLSRVLTALEAAYAEIQRRHPDVPDVSIMVSDIDEWGQAEPGQIVIAMNALRVGAAFTFDTLLHEAVHQVLILKFGHKRAKKHGKVFRAQAGVMGMQTWGQSDNLMLSPETIQAYNRQIDRIEVAIDPLVYY